MKRFVLYSLALALNCLLIAGCNSPPVDTQKPVVQCEDAEIYVVVIEGHKYIYVDGFRSVAICPAVE